MRIRRAATPNSLSRALPRVSVVIPCYNYARFLPDAVNSALAQQDVDLEIVIVDDASTDDSHAVAMELARVDSRIRVFRHEQNLGHLRTSNEALGYATGEFLVKLDADDVLAPGALARASDLLIACPSVGFVYGRAEDFTGPVPYFASEAPRHWTIWSGDVWLARVLKRAHNVIAQPEVMLRTAALHDVGGGYSEQLPWAEDYHLWLRLATRWSVGHLDGCVQGLYRVHSSSLQRSAKDLRLADLEARVDATRLYISETPGVGAERAQLALVSLAKDTRRLLAARRDDPDASVETVARYLEIVERLETDAGVRPSNAPVTWAGPIGRAARRVFDAVRWRRWRATGV